MLSISKICPFLVQRAPNPTKFLQKPFPNRPQTLPKRPKIHPKGLLEPILDQCFIKARFPTPKKWPKSGQDLPKPSQKRPQVPPKSMQKRCQKNESFLERFLSKFASKIHRFLTLVCELLAASPQNAILQKCCSRLHENTIFQDSSLEKC